MVSDEVVLHNISKSNVNLLVVLYTTIVLSQLYVQVAVHEKILSGFIGSFRLVGEVGESNKFWLSSALSYNQPGSDTATSTPSINTTRIFQKFHSFEILPQ